MGNRGDQNLATYEMEGDVIVRELRNFELNQVLEDEEESDPENLAREIHIEDPKVNKISEP